MSSRWKNGPFYGIGIIIVTVIAILLSAQGVFPSGYLQGAKLVFLLLGVLLILFGIVIWIAAAIFAKIDANITANKLVTTGIYAYVRNPLYSAFLFACTGALLCAGNLWLLLLPVIYWLCLTILMKHTEEKWLTNLYGKEYISYCKKVNRCIPWVRKQ